VLLLTGSGPQDRDQTILGHKPFLVLADYLTHQGFAVLRLDERGTGKSGGDFATATTADFASDAEAAFTYLKNHPSINKRKVGLLGHSEGALLAAKVAAKYPEIAFVVLLAGNAVPGTELLVAQNKALLENAGMPQEQLQKYLNLREAQFKVAATEKDVTKAAGHIRQLEQEAKSKLTPQEQQQLGLTDKAEQTVVAQLSSPWMRYYLAYDPAPALQKLKMPVLALNGTKDLQVPHQQNLPATEKALKAGGNQKYTIREMPELNHLFQTAKTGSPAEYGQLEETFAPTALQVIGEWMKGVVK
jgi:pimeloyl-ACP methyl ester carboxylesterase